MSYLLTAYGHVVLTADNGELGIELAWREQPDLVVCDIHLPGADGHAVANALKDDSMPRPPPIVAVTALAMVGDREKILAAGFDGYITKPIDPEVFVGQVDAFLGAELGVSRFLLRPIEPQALIDEITTCLATHPRMPNGNNPDR
jgi:CheY-like chemotaxis protein